MAKTKDEKNKDAFVKTEVNKRLFNYNDPKNFNTTYSQEDINSFLSGSNTKVQEVFGKPKSPDYIGGINPLGDQIDFTGSKYDKNIHVDQLDNLEDFRSQNQGIFDSLGRSTANLIGKTAVNIVGGVVGTAYGAVDAIAEGKISNLWDNDLTTALDKASADIGDYFKVYKSADYNDSNLLSKAFLHPIQFTDETMDALSFTTGAILTEMLTSGVASGMVGAKALKYFKQLDKIADASEIGSTLSKAGSIANGLKNTGTLTRQLATGAAYEASIEARQASNQLRDKLHQDWLQANPGASIEQMPQSIKDSIDDKLADAGLFTFMTNLALVGSSNIIQFPKVFGAGYETANKAKNFEKRLIREASGRFSDVATKASKFEKGLSKAMTIAKNPFMEGIVEEGGQGVLSGTAIDFFSRKNDESSRSSVSDFLEDFGKNLIDTYTTKEGWNEIGMGMLIGSIGAPGRGLLSFLGKNSTLGQQGFNADGTRKELWDGGIVGELRQEAEKTREISEYIQDLNNNTSIIRAMKSNYDFLVNSRFLEDRMDYALDTGDIFTYNNLKDDQVHSYITSRLKAGLSSDIDTTIEQLQQIDPSELYRELKGIESLEQASEEDQIEFKRRSIEEFKNKAEATKKAYQIVDNAYQGDNDDIRDYFAHSIAKAKYTDLREKAINKAVSDLSYGALNNLNTRSLDTVTIKDEIESLNTILKEENIDEIEAEKINTLLNALNIVEDKQRSLTREEYNALQLVGQADDLNLSLNIDKITSLLEDSRKLRKQRQEYISVYNQIFTKEGQAKVKAEQDAYNNMLKAQEEAKIEAERVAKAEADRIKEEEQVIANQKETKLKVDSLKETAQVKKNESVEDDEIYDELSFSTATLLDKNGKVVSTNPSTQDKIADIERRRQEELEYATFGSRQEDLEQGRKNTSEIVNIIKNKYSNKTLIGKIIRLLENLIDFQKFATVRVENLKGGSANGQAMNGGMVLDSLIYDSILEGDSRAIKTFIHEAIHHLLDATKWTAHKSNPKDSNLSNKEIKAWENLERIFEKVKSISKTNAYGLTNLNEFLAEAFSNESFQRDLAEIEGEGKKSNLLKDILNSVVELLQEQLNKWGKRFNKEVPNLSNSILEDIFAWSEDLIDIDRKISDTSLLSEINAKYNAELAALNVETITPEENTVAEIVNYEEVHTEETELNKDGLVVNNNTDVSKYNFDDLSFKREAGNTLNSLNIKYSERILGDTEKQSDEYRIFDEYTEDGKLDIISNFDSRLQDPNQFNKGTILKVIIPTYDQIKQKGIELEGYTEDQFNNDSKSSKNIPIALTDSNDKIIGYLSTQDNIKKRVKPELIDIELVKNIELRNKIFENKDSNMTLTISNKSTGTPMLQKNKVSIYDALGDGTKLAKDVKIGIFKEGKLQIGTNIINQDRLKLPEGVSESDYFNEGFAYAIVPTASKDTYFAMNLDASQVGDRSNEIIKILELYKATDKFKEDKNLLTLRDQLSVEADFTNFKDVSDALNNIIYINNDNDNHILRLDKNKLILGATPDMQFTWNQFRDPVIKENIKNILSNRSSAIKLANFGTPFSTFVNNNGNFEFKRYNNYFDYINEYEILKSNQQSEPITGTTNSRYFTAQSVIELGDLKINSNTPSNPIVESINTQVEEPKGVKMSSKPKNKLGLKIPNKNKPRIDEDFSEIYTLENKTLDEQVNDLIKKCSK